jgi:hypothetical protein
MLHYAQPSSDEKVVIVINNNLGGFLYPKQLRHLKPDVLISSGFGGMGDKFDLVSPPTANRVIAKTSLEDSHNIINNHEKPYKQ